MKTMLVVNYCGHGEEFIPWPEAGDYWTLVPMLEESGIMSAGSAGRTPNEKDEEGPYDGLLQQRR